MPLNLLMSRRPSPFVCQVYEIPVHWAGVPLNTIRIATIKANLK